MRLLLAVAFLDLVLFGCAPMMRQPVRPIPAPRGTFPIEEATIAAAQSAIKSHITTCTASSRSTCPGSLSSTRRDRRWNAITVVNPRALDEADAMGSAVRAGRTMGLLQCVPMW
jgi:hypothetical protein